MRELMVVEHGGQRVLTTQQIAEAYETDSKIITRNFERNKDKFKHGKHYFALTGEDLIHFKGSRQNDDSLKYVSVLYVWTELGAWLLAKSLNTDKAWSAYETLVDEYYRLASMIQQHTVPQTFAEALRLAADLAEQNEKLLPKAAFFEAVADSKDAIEIGHAAKVLNIGIGRNNLFKVLRDKRILQSDNIPYQEYIDRGYFRTIEQKWTTPDGEVKISFKTLVYQRGLDYIRKLLQKSNVS